MTTRRQFLAHAGGLGLGTVFWPHLGVLAENADDTHRHSANVVLEPVRTDGLALISYFVGDKKSGTAAVIDPRRDVEVFLKLAAKHNMKITHALETHIHADFVSGSRELADRTGTTKIYASVEGDASYGFPVEPLRHKTDLDLGNIQFTVLHTPGHTPEHVSYLAVETSATEKPWALFTGDFLFVDSIGRPDLLGVENTERLAKILFHTIETGFRGLPDAVPIYPAHGAGSPCGSNIADRDSTLGNERRQNPALQFKEETKFIEWLLSAQPPVPYYWPRMKKLNAAGPEILKGLPRIGWLSPTDFQSMVAKSGVQLIDNRQMLAYSGGHIGGALNIGPTADLSMWAGWMLDPEQPIALVLTKESDLSEVLNWFSRVGYTKFAGALEGGMDAWVQEGLPLDAIPSMSVQQVRKTFPSKEMQLLDVRQPIEWDMGHIPGAKHVFLPELAKKLDRLDTSKPVVVYCSTGYRSSIAAGILKHHGFTVYNVPGSFKGWTAAGYPVEEVL